MFVVVVAHDEDGNIKMTKDELQKMLDDAYQKGKEDERLRGFYTLTTPSTYYSTYSCSGSSGSSSTVHITCE